MLTLFEARTNGWADRGSPQFFTEYGPDEWIATRGTPERVAQMCEAYVNWYSRCWRSDELRETIRNESRDGWWLE